MNLQWENKVDNEDFVSAEDINAVANAIIKLQEDFEKNKMSEIDQTYDPTSKNAQSGKAVAEAVATKMDKFADVTIENDGMINKKFILDTPNAQFEMISGDPHGDGDISKLALVYGSAKLISRSISGLYGGADGKIEVAPFIGLDSDFWYAYGEPMGEYPIAQIVADFLGVKDKDGNPIRIINVADPKNDLDVANKQYVDGAVKPQKQTFANGETITITDNTEYTASEEITNLTIIYPNTDFICSFNFTLASTGNITITLPESKYIGSVPSFSYGETWELNIKNGVVVGGKVE